MEVHTDGWGVGRGHELQHQSCSRSESDTEELPAALTPGHGRSHKNSQMGKYFRKALWALAVKFSTTQQRPLLQGIQGASGKGLFLCFLLIEMKNSLPSVLSNLRTF